MMKKLIPLLILLAVLSACDSPRSQRSVYNNSSNGLGNGYGYDYNSPTDGRGAGTNNASSTNTTTTDPNIPEDAKHCKWIIYFMPRYR
jgi:hypothetical protein